MNNQNAALNSTVAWLGHKAPWANLIVPIGIVITLGYFHFNHILTTMMASDFFISAYAVAFAVWILLASARIALLFATVADFSNRDYLEGSLGFLASVGVLIFDLWFLGQICKAEFGETAQLMTTVTRALSILSVIMEARLVLLLWDSSSRRKQKTKTITAYNNGSKPTLEPMDFS